MGCDRDFFYLVGALNPNFKPPNPAYNLSLCAQLVQCRMDRSCVSNGMSIFERLLAPDCTEGPKCKCGEEMKIAGVDELANSIDAEIRIYKCPSCQHEMRLTVWTDDLSA